MAKKQTRRSVSIRGTTYDRIRGFCEREGISMSEFVEARIAVFFDGSAPAPVKSKQLPKPPIAKPVDRSSVAAQPPAARPTVERPAPAPMPKAQMPEAQMPKAQMPKAQAKPASAPRLSAPSSGGNGKKADDDALSFDELQDAARCFTF